MQLTLNKQSALRLLRIARARNGKRGLSSGRTRIANPDPTPRRRWNKGLFEQALASWDPRALENGPLQVCVDDQRLRLGSALVENTVYHDEVPKRPCLALDRSIRIVCPELLFIELAASMSLPEHLLLGFELCGSFARDADDPIGGEATFGTPAVTSVESIRRVLAACGRVSGKPRAERTLQLLADNAWSPMETAIAVMVSLPLQENGYGLGRCKLNPRVEPSRLLANAAEKESRVPDIMVGGSCVGLNYDGEYHLDLDSLVEAALRFARNPGSRQAERELDDVKRRIRAQVIDDNRRNRELIADGLVVFPVFREDLYDESGFDATMMQVMQAMRLYGGWKDDGRMELIASRAARAERRELLTSLIPGRTREVRGDTEEAIVSLKNRVW